MGSLCKRLRSSVSPHRSLVALCPERVPRVWTISGAETLEDLLRLTRYESTLTGTLSLLFLGENERTSAEA